MQIGHLDYHAGDLIIASAYVAAMPANKAEEYVNSVKTKLEEFFGAGNVLVLATRDERTPSMSLVVVHRHK